MFELVEVARLDEANASHPSDLASRITTRIRMTTSKPDPKGSRLFPSRHAFTLAALMLAIGCGDDDATPPDASSRDSGPPDGGAVGDADVGDADVDDADLVDAEVPVDASTPELPPSIGSEPW